MEKSNVIALKDFFNHNTTRPVVMSEMQAFWTALSPEEKAEFGEAARAQNKANGLPGY